MVDITNGINTITVTKGAFDGIYKHQGYTLVHDYASSIQVKPSENIKSEDNNYIGEIKGLKNDSQEETDKVDDSESLENELLEKPISQWSQEELREYAEENGISLEGVTKAKEARNIIKNFIDSQK